MILEGRYLRILQSDNAFRPIEIRKKTDTRRKIR
jgi:hypothetical protein